MTFAEPAARPRREAPAAPQLSQLDKTLKRGEFLMNEEMFDEARDAFEQAKQQAGGSHAQASYGLARVAIMEADPGLGARAFPRGRGASRGPAHAGDGAHLHRPHRRRSGQPRAAGDFALQAGARRGRPRPRERASSPNKASPRRSAGRGRKKRLRETSWAGAAVQQPVE